MTLKERILGWFDKKDSKPNSKPEITLDDLEEEFDDDFEDDFYLQPFEFEAIQQSAALVDKEAVQGTKEYNLEDLIKEFELDVPGKKAIWGGKETKAFLKWKADHNL